MMPIKLQVLVNGDKLVTKLDDSQGFSLNEMGLFNLELDRIKAEILDLAKDMTPDFYISNKKDDDDDDTDK